MAWGGTAAMFLSLFMAWWGLTRYRVLEERDVNLQNPDAVAAISKDKSAEELNDYKDRKIKYEKAWEAVTQSPDGKFYDRYLGVEYVRELTRQDIESQRSGSVYVRGYYTWTGWFLLIGLIAIGAAQAAPKFAAEQVEPIAWALPWVGTVVAGMFALLAVAFFFTVPDANGDGYAQGVSLGNLLAITAGIVAAIGWSYEGLKAADRRLAEMDADEEDEDESDEAEAVVTAKPMSPTAKPAQPAAPPQPPKNRLTDW